MYTVVKDLPERFDSNYTYKKGDAYPRAGFTPPKGRAKALCDGKKSDLNRTGEKYLQAIVQEVKKPKDTKEEE